MGASVGAVVALVLLSCCGNETWDSLQWLRVSYHSHGRSLGHGTIGMMLMVFLGGQVLLTCVEH